MFDSVELANARADMSATFIATVAIYRNTQTVTAGGDLVDSWGLIETKWGRIMILNRQDSNQVIGDRPDSISFYSLTCDYDADLRDGDRILIGGKWYEVAQVHADSTQLLCVRAVVAEVVE